MDNTATYKGNQNQFTADSRNVQREVKSNIHKELLNRLDLSFLDQLSRPQLDAQIGQIAREIMDELQVRLNSLERAEVIKQVQDEVSGLGPIESLVADPTISDILVNTWREVYVERYGRLSLTDVQFQNDGHLMGIIDKITSTIGRRVDESSPMVDARLKDGSRVNVVIPPAAVDGPIMSIRKFRADPLTLENLTATRSLSPPMFEFLKAAVIARANILISGGTGSGKTTLLNALSRFIADDERVITIEDSAELQLQGKHVVRLETRPANIEGKGEIYQGDLLKNALRMRPDRIIVGEVRGGEALDMLQAMNTGHDGSMTTIHANSPRDALTRLEHMVAMSGVPIPALVIRQQVVAALHILVDAERLADGRRVVTSIQEITGMELETVEMQEIFNFEKSGVDANGMIVGRFTATGIVPQINELLIRSGVALDNSVYNPEKAYE